MKTKLLVTAIVCVLLWVGCSGNKEHKQYATTDSTGRQQDTTKLVKTADIDIRVKNAQNAGDDIADMTQLLGGMVMHHSLKSVISKSEEMPSSDDSVMHVTSYTTNAEMTVRIPSESLEKFMNAVSHMAIYIDSRDMDIQDKTIDYAAQKMKAQNRSQLIRAENLGKIKVKSPADYLATKDDIVNRVVDNLKTDQAVNYSNVTLNIHQNNTVIKEQLANDDPSVYRLPILKRLVMAFKNGWLMINEVVILLLNLWAFVLLGIAITLAVRFYLKRKKLVLENP